MIRILFGRSFLNVNDGVSPGFAPIAGGGSQLFVATEAFASYKWPIASTWNRLTVTLSVAPGGVTARTYAFRVNGVDTGLTVTISGTQTTATVTSAVATAAGDLVSLHRTATGSPAAATSSWTIETNSADTVTSAYGWHCDTNLTSSGVNYIGPFASHGLGAWNGVANNFRSLMPIAGAITAYAIGDLSAAPGAGLSWSFAIWKNGTKQDGTAGTPNTVATITDAAISTAWAGSLTVAAADVIELRATPSGTPATTKAPGSITFQAATPGLSILAGGRNGLASTTVTEYQAWATQTSSWDPTESAAENLGNVTPVVLRDLSLLLSAAPGASKSYTVRPRVNGATPVGAPSVTVTGAGVLTGSAAGVVQLGPGGAWALESVPVGTPTAANIYWAFGMALPNTGRTQAFQWI